MNDVTSDWNRLARALDAHDQAMVARPFAHIIRTSGMRIVGIGGPPGAGKSTIARAVADDLRTPEDQPLVMSLDDFYFSKEERATRGLPWRGPPGSHDLPALLAVLDELRARRSPIAVQKFSAETDDRIEPITISKAPDQVLLEGWILGHKEDGYGAILDRLDLMAFIDIDEATARIRRFEREKSLREHGGGFTEEEMRSFWDEILGPGIPRWVNPAKASADLVIEMTPDGLRSVRTANPIVIAALHHQR